MVLVGLKQYPGSIFHPGITLLRPTLAIRLHKVLKGQEEQLQEKRWTLKKNRPKDFKRNRERNQQIRPKVAKQGKRSRGAVIMKKDPTAKRCWKSWASASHGSWNEANPQPFDTLAGQGAAQLQFHSRVWPLVVKNRVTKKGESGPNDGIRNWKYCKHHSSWKAAASPVTSPLQQAEESVTVQHRVSSWSPETISSVGAQLGHGCKVFPSSSISFLPGAPLPPVMPALRHRAVIPPEELLMLQNTPEKKPQVYE